MVMLPELGLSTALNFLIGLSLFLFSVTLDFFFVRDWCQEEGV